MALKVVEEACTVAGTKLVIVVEGKGPDEVIGNDAKNLAVQKAAEFGYARVGINGTSGAYPVDKTGTQWDDVNEQAKRGEIAAYRNEISLMSGL